MLDMRRTRPRVIVDIVRTKHEVTVIAVQSTSELPMEAEGSDLRERVVVVVLRQRDSSFPEPRDRPPVEFDR
jgi:hypothetical protein